MLGEGCISGERMGQSQDRFHREIRHFLFQRTQALHVFVRGNVSQKGFMQRGVLGRDVPQ